MSRPRTVSRPWQVQAQAAQRRDVELRRAEELQRVASYFDRNTKVSKQMELWNNSGYYEKANKDAELLCEQKIRAAQLEERRKKLEYMLFQEHMQYQQELKNLASQPKLFKNGSYLNSVPTSTLQEINQGIMAKEEALRRHEAELKLHHAWRMRQPELRAASSFLANGKLKSAWTEQIVEKELQKKKEEEDTRRLLKERDEAISRQIQVEQMKLKEKELKVKELRSGLESQISELTDKEKLVKHLRVQEEREKLLLDELACIARDREREHARLVVERDTCIVNMGLHKYKLKRKVVAVLKEIELDLGMLERLRKALLKDYESEKNKCALHKQVLDEALRELEECREKERVRQKNIDAMYDGEARQINEKQDQLWAKERQARASLMADVLATLKRQVEANIEANRQRQRANVLEREKILDDMESFHHEVREKERETKFQNSTYSNITSLQSELNRLKLSQQKLEDAVSREADMKAEMAHERAIRTEIARMQREGTGHLPAGRNWKLDSSYAEYAEEHPKGRRHVQDMPGYEKGAEVGRKWEKDAVSDEAPKGKRHVQDMPRFEQDAEKMKGRRHAWS